MCIRDRVIGVLSEIRSSQASEGDASVAKDRLACHIGGLVAGEEEMQAGDVRGASEPAEGDAANELLLYLPGYRVEHLCFDGTRGYAVDAHRVAGELLGERFVRPMTPALLAA